MNIDYVKNQKGFLHILRLIILIICIVYMNILSCGQNAFGGHANVNSTSDSEFIHISKHSFSYMMRRVRCRSPGNFFYQRMNHS
jgi:hypothetical protein